MKQFIITLITTFSLMNNQSVSAMSFKQEMKSLSESVSQYNQMRLSPLSFTSVLDARDKKTFESVLKKSRATMLPEIVKTSDGKYQMTAGENHIIFDELKWNKKIIIINNFAVSLSKINNMNQLIDTMKKTLITKPKQTGLYQKIKDIILPNAYSEMGNQDLASRGYDSSSSWYTNPYVIGAGLIALLGIAYLIGSNGKKKNSSNAVNAGANASSDGFNSGGDVGIGSGGSSSSGGGAGPNLGGVDKNQFSYFGKVASGQQFDVVVKNEIIHLLSDQYYQLDKNGKVTLSENYGDSQQCGLCFFPAIDVTTEGEVHTITRQGGDMNGGYDIKYRKRSVEGQWQYDYVFGGRKKRNYVVGVAAASSSEVYMTSSEAGFDVWGDIHVWKEANGQATEMGKISKVWRADSFSKIRGNNGMVFFASGNPSGPIGGAYYSYCTAGANCFNELNSNMKTHKSGSGRQGATNLYVDKQGDVHFTYGASQSVYYNRFTQGKTQAFSKDILLFDHLGDAPLDGIGVSAIAASDDGAIIVAIAVHNQSGDILVTTSKDQGKTFDEVKKLGVQTRVDEARRIPGIVAIGNKFFIFYWNRAINGIGLITTEL